MSELASYKTASARTSPHASAFRTVEAFRSPLAVAAALAACIGYAYFEGVENLVQRWSEQEELSHGFFLPVIAAYILWERRSALLLSAGKPAQVGFVGLAAALAALFISEATVTSLMIFQQISMILAVASLCLILGGRGFFRTAILPIAFLLFMIPPPHWVITVLSWKFQFWSSALGVRMIELTGAPVFLSGNIIDLGDYQLAVAEACSGLRYLFPFLSLGFLAAYLFPGPIWARMIICAATVPITIVMNSLRIAATGILVDAYGVEHAEGALHLFEGWVVFVLCLVFLFGVILAMSRLLGRSADTELLVLPDIAPDRSGGEWRRAPFERNAVIAGLAIVAAGAIANLAGDDHLRTPDRRDLDGLAADFNGWRVSVREIGEETLQALGADDYIIADLAAPTEERFNLYVAYLDMQRDGHSWHSPRQCIPGGGWKIASHDIVRADPGTVDPFHVNRLIIENRGRRELVYYWYDQRSRRIANEFVMKAFLLIDAVRLRRTDGAMIRIMTTIAEDEAVEAADARISNFMKELQPKLPSYVPPAD